MKFIIEPQHGIKQETVIVWDAEKGQELCTFTNGEFETEDTYVTEKLTELGYESESAAQQLTNDDAVIEEALRAKAKELGIKSWHIKSVDTLTEEIAEKEKGGV